MPCPPDVVRLGAEHRDRQGGLSGQVRGEPHAQRDGRLVVAPREGGDAVPQPVQQVPVDLARVGPPAGEPDQRLGPLHRPARRRCRAPAGTRASRLGDGAALVERVTQRQVQARPYLRVWPGPARSRSWPRISAASPLTRSALAAARKARAASSAGRSRSAPRACPAMRTGSRGSGSAASRTRSVSAANARRCSVAPQRGVGVEPGGRTSSRWLPWVNLTPAEVSIHPVRRARCSSASASRTGQVKHPGDERGVDGQVGRR